MNSTVLVSTSVSTLEALQVQCATSAVISKMDRILHKGGCGAYATGALRSKRCSRVSLPSLTCTTPLYCNGHPMGACCGIRLVHSSYTRARLAANGINASSSSSSSSSSTSQSSA